MSDTERLQAAIKLHEKAYADLKAANEKLQEELAEAMEYAQHDENCGVWFIRKMSSGCDCGFDAFRAKHKEQK